MLVWANQVSAAWLGAQALGYQALTVDQVLANRQGADMGQLVRPGRQCAKHQQGEVGGGLAQQPSGLAIGPLHGCIGERSARHLLAVKSVPVGRVQGRVAQYGGHRQPAAVNQAAGKRVLPGQVQRSIPKQLADWALGRDEIGGSGGMANVFIGGVLALCGIAVQQGWAGPAFEQPVKLPAQVVGVLHAAVGATRTKGRDPVGAVTGKKHGSVYELVHALTSKGVDRGPLQRELPHWAQQRLDAGHDVFGFFLFLRVRVPAELEIYAPNAVGLAVQEHTLARVKRRVKPEPALGRKIRFHFHVSNQKAVLKHPPAALEPHQRAQRRAVAVAGHEPVGRQLVGAVWRLDRQQRSVCLHRQRADPVMPTQVYQRQLQRTLDQIGFTVILLQVDEGRARMLVFRQKIELINLLVLEENSAKAPGHPLVDHRLSYAQPVPNLQRALGKADGTRSAGQAGAIVQK